MNKVLFVLCIIYTLGIGGLIGYAMYTSQLDLAVMFALVLGASILNCGNFYGYIKNEELAKKWEEANK